MKGVRRVRFFFENGAYIILGRRVPNMWVSTSLWAETSRTWCKSMENLETHESIDIVKLYIESGLQIPAGRPDSKLEVQIFYFYMFTFVLYILICFIFLHHDFVFMT